MSLFLLPTPATFRAANVSSATVFQRWTVGRGFSLRFDADFQSNSGSKIADSSTRSELAPEPSPSSHLLLVKTLSARSYVTCKESPGTTFSIPKSKQAHANEGKYLDFTLKMD